MVTYDETLIRRMYFLYLIYFLILSALVLRKCVFFCLKNLLCEGVIFLSPECLNTSLTN